MSVVIYAILCILNVTTIGLLTGGLMIVTVTDVPLFLWLPLQDYVIVHREIDRYMHPYMPLLSGLALLSGLVELWFSHTSWQTVSLLIGIASIATIAALSELVNVPLNRKIAAWTPELSGNELPEIRKRWINSHYLRTAAGLIGFVCLIIPVAMSSHL